MPVKCLGYSFRTFRFVPTYQQDLKMIKRRFTISLALALALSLPLASSHAAGGSVENATFTSAISGNAPTDYRQQFSNDTPVVYFYGELLDLKGQTVSHRWSLEGKQMQVVPIKVTKVRQPAWSKSAMQPEWTGNWTVEVVDKDGNVLRRSNFAYNPN